MTDASTPQQPGMTDPVPAESHVQTAAEMAWTLEVIVVPVSDIDRAKSFYADQLGFTVDHDVVISADARIVQLTPPGSGCSIVIGKGAVPDMAPGSITGLQLVVADLERAHAQLIERGVQVSDIQIMGENPADTPHPLDNVGFCFFTDPDGNGWAIQQISSRAATLASSSEATNT